ncbi:MAG: hypothetical protein WDO74_20960 [Pseudomonadota bacterium]
MVSELKPKIVAVDPSPLVARLYWLPLRHLIPMATDPTFVARPTTLIEQKRPDVVTLGADVELPILAHQGAVWAAQFGTNVMVSHPEVVGIANDSTSPFGSFATMGGGSPSSANKWGLSIVILKSFLTEAILSAEFACVVLPA